MIKNRNRFSALVSPTWNLYNNEKKMIIRTKSTFSLLLYKVYIYRENVKNLVKNKRQWGRQVSQRENREREKEVTRLFTVWPLKRFNSWPANAPAAAATAAKLATHAAAANDCTLCIIHYVSVIAWYFCICALDFWAWC